MQPSPAKPTSPPPLKPLAVCMDWNAKRGCPPRRLHPPTHSPTPPTPPTPPTMLPPPSQANLAKPRPLQMPGCDTVSIDWNAKRGFPAPPASSPIHMSYLPKPPHTCITNPESPIAIGDSPPLPISTSPQPRPTHCRQPKQMIAYRPCPCHPINVPHASTIPTVKL